MGPILSSEQIHNIAVDLLEMPRDDAFLRIGGMQVSDADRRRIISEYNDLYSARHPEEHRDFQSLQQVGIEEQHKTVPNIDETNARLAEEKKAYDESLKKASWWHYLVGVVGSIAIFIWLPSLIALVISFFSFFWSAFDAGITMLFAPAISAALGIMLLATMLPKGAKSWIMCITIILSTVGGIASVNNFFFFNDIFYGIGYAISVAVTIIAGSYQIKDECNNAKLRTSNLVAITLTAVFCAIYAFVVISSNALTYNRYGSALAYWTESGAVYHLDPDCPTLANSGDVYSTSIDEAMFRGKERVCNMCG